MSAPTWNFWYHICIDINTSKRSMDTAINGKVVSNRVELGEGVAEEMPRKLQGKLVVGKWNYTFTGKEEQFLWSFTNFKIFKGSDSLDLAMLTKDLCKRQGDILAWDTMKWRVAGDKMEEVEERAETVCRQPTTYKLLLSETKEQQEAVATCDKLGHGMMGVAANKEEIKELVRWAIFAFFLSCFFG